MRVPPQSADQKQPSAFPRVLVSVLSYNSDCNLFTTLRSLQQQTYPNYRLQLVNNASTVGLPESVRREFPTLGIRTLSENIGYTGGSNFALRQGVAEGYDYVLLCTHDIEVDAKAIEHLIETAIREPDTGIVGGLEVRSGGIGRMRIATARFSKWTARIQWLSHSSDGESSQQVPYVHGALVLFAPGALTAGLLMDENLFMYFDEIDIGMRLKEHGLRAYTDPRVLVRHKRRPSRYDAREGYLMQRNRVYMLRKYGCWYHRMFFNACVALFELPAKVFLRSLQGHADFAWACVCGYVDGLRGQMGRGRNV